MMNPCKSPGCEDVPTNGRGVCELTRHRQGAEPVYAPWAGWPAQATVTRRCRREPVVGAHRNAPGLDQASGASGLPPGPGTSSARRAASSPGVTCMSVSTCPASRSRLAWTMTGSGSTAAAWCDSSGSCGSVTAAAAGGAGRSGAFERLLARTGVGVCLPTGARDVDFNGWMDMGVPDEVERIQPRSCRARRADAVR